MLPSSAARRRFRSENNNCREPKFYKTVVDYASGNNNIFEVSNINDRTSISIKIGYKEKVETALLNEQTTYKQTGTPLSDFYLLKEIYEPTLRFSLNFFLTNLNALNLTTNSFSREETGKLYDQFTNVKKSVDAFQNTLTSFNYYENYFESGEYLDKKGIVYKQLDNIKVKYSNMINDCFTLNNKFIDLYFSIYNTTDFRAEPNKQLYGLYVQMLCNQTVAKLAQTGFLVDGLKCNFLNTNKSSFEIETESNVIDHTYTKHLSQISDISKSLLNKTSADFDNINQSMKNKIIVLQTQTETFNKQYPIFENALNQINYRDFVASNKTLEEYSQTVNTDQKSYLYIVEDFLNSNYSTLCGIVEDIIAHV